MVQADASADVALEKSPDRRDAVPASVVSAICEIMRTVDAVKKSQKNQHGGYMFASTDDIYAALTRKMGEVGLVLLTGEDHCEVVRVEKDGKISQWARIVFTFTWATAKGTWTDPTAKRTLYIQVTGPQTFQAAQSFAEKGYLRSTFKIPTGDQDLDSIAQGDTEEDQQALNGKGKRKSSASAKRDGTDDVFNGIRAEISEAYGNRQALVTLRTRHAETWRQMPARWVEILDAEYEDALASSRDAAE